MEKITSFRKGNVWINVFETEHGELSVTINRSFRDRDGNWRNTPFFRPHKGDLIDLLDALCQFMEFRDDQKDQAKSQIEEIKTLQRWVQ